MRYSTRRNRRYPVALNAVATSSRRLPSAVVLHIFSFVDISFLLHHYFHYADDAMQRPELFHYIISARYILSLFHCLFHILFHFNGSHIIYFTSLYY